MNEKTLKTKSYLKNLRTSKKVTVQKLADELGISKGYLSQIESINENVSKKIPDKEFIFNFIGKMSDSIDEFEMHINKINELGNLNLSIPTHVDSFMDVVPDASRAPHLHVEFDTDAGKVKSKYYPFRINDIKHHLLDMKNDSFYNDYQLSNDDRESIDRMISEYLFNKMNIRESHIDELHETGIIKDKTHQTLLADIYDSKEKIKI